MLKLSKSSIKAISGIIFGILSLIFSAYYTNYTKAQAVPNKELPIQVYFTPWDNAEDAIINTINEAKHSIYIQAYVWTSKPLTDAIINAKKRGLAIYLLCDKDQMTSSKYSLVPDLVNAGITVKLEVKYQNAHNKIIILDYNADEPTVITGSYNFSYSAQHRNSENVLIIKDSKIAHSYFTNWQRHSNEALMY
jgi:phosphatidylserine/phosphatidylglycerophosphate/cardiolipin synthase-like enzyme